jgi:hypothetical protein
MQKNISSSDKSVQSLRRTDSTFGNTVKTVALAALLIGATSGCEIVKTTTFTPELGYRVAQAGQPAALTTNMVQRTQYKVEPLVLFAPVFLPVWEPSGVILIGRPGPLGPRDWRR